MRMDTYSNIFEKKRQGLLSGIVVVIRAKKY